MIRDQVMLAQTSALEYGSPPAHLLGAPTPSKNQRRRSGNLPGSLPRPDPKLVNQENAVGDHDPVHGEAILVSVIADKKGKWHKVLGQKWSSARRRDQLLKHLGDPGTMVHGECVLVGFAVLYSWSLERPPRSSAVCELLLDALTQHNRQAQRATLLSHKVLMAASLAIPLEIKPSEVSTVNWWARCRSEDLFLIGPGGFPRSSVDGTRRLPGWEKHSHVNDKGVHSAYIWKVWGPLARGLVERSLPYDLTMVTGLARSSGLASLPVKPPDHILRSESIDTTARWISDVGLANVDEPKLDRPGYLTAFEWNPEVKIQSASLYMETMSCERQNLVVNKACDLVEMVRGNISDIVIKQSHFPTSTDSVEVKDVIPCKSVVLDAVKQMDMAAMRARREWYAVNGPVFRYLFIDASPIGGIEVLNTVEITIRQVLVGGSAMSVKHEAIERRRLPGISMGVGSCDGAAKTAGSLHQSWLEYGPSEHSLRQICIATRMIMSDMGVERVIVNYFDIISWYIGGHDIDKLDNVDRLSFLYPNALQVVGPLHIIDWLIRETLASVKWFPEFLKHCKLVLQYLNQKSHRDYMIEKLKEKMDPGPELDEMTDGFSTACNRFANWRWRSIKTASESYRGYCAPLRHATAHEDVRTWSSKEADALKAIALTCSHPDEEDKARAIDYIIEEPMLLLGWITGCDCHEQERRQGQKVNCKKAGMRAPGFERQVRMTMHRIEEKRDSLQPGQFGPSVDVAELHAVMTQLIGRMQAKLLSWLEDIPYLLWQAPSLAMV